MDGRPYSAARSYIPNVPLPASHHPGTLSPSGTKYLYSLAIIIHLTTGGITGWPCTHPRGHHGTDYGVLCTPVPSDPESPYGSLQLTRRVRWALSINPGQSRRDDRRQDSATIKTGGAARVSAAAVSPGVQRGRLLRYPAAHPWTPRGTPAGRQKRVRRLRKRPHPAPPLLVVRRPPAVSARTTAPARLITRYRGGQRGTAVCCCATGGGAPGEPPSGRLTWPGGQQSMAPS